MAEVRAAISIPFAVKLSPYYSALAGFAGKVVAAGADGLVLFNRFYQPDLDLDTFDVVTKVALSHPSELRHAAPLDRDPPAAAGRLDGPRGHVRHPRGGPTRSRRSSWAPTS